AQAADRHPRTDVEDGRHVDAAATAVGRGHRDQAVGLKMPLEGLLGRKLGMTQVFDKQGQIHGVTVIEAGPIVVSQMKTAAKDGYEAVQVAYGTRKRVNKPARGHLKKLGD